MNDCEPTARKSEAPATLSHRPPSLGWLLPMGFGVVAVALFATSRKADIPLEPAAIVQPSELVVGPRRSALADPPRIMVEGVPQSCNGCHQIFKSDSAAGVALSYHQDVQLSHGLNNRCVNCHDVTNRELLTLRDGATVGFSETPQLCAQCHGTVYRDWQRGTHGKTLGSWITGSEAQHRLSCNECHNPHSPRYEPYSPLPGPNTLRMGTPEHTPAHAPGGKLSPLQRWLHTIDSGPTPHPQQQGARP